MWDKYSMSKELETWKSAHEAFIQQDYHKSLELYQEICYLSKISFNIGSIYLLLNEYQKSIEYFTSSIQNDEYLLISFFQRGNCYFTVGKIELAAQDYSRILKILKENINYSQLGMEYELYKTEVLFNRALCYMGMGLKDESLEDLEMAKIHANPIHSKTLQEFGWESRIFMVKQGLQFQISKYKLQSSKKWLKNAESVTQDSTFLGFLGSKVVYPKNVFYSGSRGKSVVRKEASGIHSKNTMATISDVRNSLHSEPVSSKPPTISVRNSLPVHLVRSVNLESIKSTNVPVPPTRSSRILSFTAPRKGQVFIASFRDNSGSIPLKNTLGVFHTKKDAEDSCKEFISTALGEIENESVDWIQGWVNGDYCVSVSLQQL